MKILYVCTGNTCRSPMAQAITADLAKKRGLKDVVVDSAGTGCPYGDPMAENAVKAIKARGIEFSHESNKVTEQNLSESDAVICMTPIMRFGIERFVPEGKLYSANDFIGHEIPDPYGGSPEVYEECARQLEKLAAAVLDKLCGSDNK